MQLVLVDIRTSTCRHETQVKNLNGSGGGGGGAGFFCIWLFLLSTSSNGVVCFPSSGIMEYRGRKGFVTGMVLCCVVLYWIGLDWIGVGLVDKGTI